MTAWEQELIAEHQRFRASLTEDELKRYDAEREEEARVAALKARRREHSRHQLGLGLIWLSTLVFAFAFGYSTGHSTSKAFTVVWVWIVIGAFMGGVVLMGTNRHERD